MAYDGRSGSSQVIRPGNSMQRAHWGTDELNKQQQRMAQIAMKMAMSQAGGGGEGEFNNPSGFESGDLQWGDGQDVDVSQFGSETDPLEDDAYLSASGMESGDPLGMDEMSPEDIRDDTDPFEMTADDPKVQYAKKLAMEQKQMDNATAMQTGGRLSEMARMQEAQQFAPETQLVDSPYFATGQAPPQPQTEMQPPPMSPQALQEMQRRRMMMNSGQWWANG